jgi:hypothetical protein
MKRIVVACALALALVPIAHAQVDRASLSGTVRDSQGAVIAGCSVDISHLGTNLTTRVRSNNEGTFLAVNLMPGSYRVDLAAEGFKKASQTVVLETGQRGRLDVTLGMGNLSEAVTVEVATRLLNTEQAALGTNIDQNSVAKLPLAVRNWDDLLVLVPGVQGDRYSEVGAPGTSRGRTGGVNVHGNRSLQNNFLLDGVDNNSISENVQELSTQVSRPSVDAIQEFKLVTSPYSAEYGRMPGAAISVTTKSGQNRVFGTAYDYYRNDTFDANNFFANRAGQPKAANDQNQFGGNFGGPIVKDKAFFFVDYEGTRITRGLTLITRIPTMDERAGVFTTPVKDPLTGQSFPGNRIPAERIDPTAAALFALLPAPNQPGTNNWISQPNVTDDADRVVGRLDYRFSPSDSVFARYIWSNRKRHIPGHFGGVIDGTSSSSGGRQTIKGQGLVLGWTRILSSSLVNEFRFSWSGADSDGLQDPYGQLPPTEAQVKGVEQDPIFAGGVVRTQIDGYFGGTNIGSPDFLPKFQHTSQFEYLDTLSWLKGNHQLKLGVDVLTPMNNEYLDVPAMRGMLRFRTRFTGNAVADYLLGYVSDAQLSNLFVVNQRHWATMFFVQDDWKVTAKLSVNVGLRYDFMTPAYEADNHMANFDPATATLVYAQDGSLEDRTLMNPDRNNFAPRLGFVYKLSERMLVRGGYGIFYNIFNRAGSEDQLALNVPGLVNNVVTSSNTAPLFLLNNGFPAGFLDPSAPGLLTRARVRAIDPDSQDTKIQQYSIGFQGELGSSFVLSVDAVGTSGSDLAELRNLNQPVGGSGPLPYPGYGFIEYRSTRATSSYKGIDVSLERRFKAGWSLAIAYTLGKATDDSGEHLNTPISFPQNGYDLSAWEGPADYDVRHRLVANFVAELPFGEGKKWATSGVGKAILGGWTLAGIYTIRTGLPFTVTQNNSIGINMTPLPNRVGDGAGPETVEQWFDPKAFALAPNGAFGNSGRNILRAPGWQSADMSLQRRFRVSDRSGITFRWDVFNLFNHPNFGFPDNNLSNTTTVGSITSLGGDPRLMQFALRVDF